MSTKKWLLHNFILKHKLKYFLGITALIIASSISMVIPKFLGKIMDSLADGTIPTKQTYTLTFYMLLFAFAVFVFKFVYRYFIRGMAREVHCELREKLFIKFQSLSQSFYNARKTGELMSYILNDIKEIRRLFAFGISATIESVVVTLISLYLMSNTISPVLTIISLFPILFSLVFLTLFRSKIKDKFRVVQESFAFLSDKIQENVAGIRVIKSFVQEKNEIKSLEKLSSNRVNIQLDYIKTSEILPPISQICLGLSYTLVLTFGGLYVNRGDISLGDFVAFNSYLALISSPLARITRIVTIWQTSLASMIRLDNIFNEVPEIIEIPEKPYSFEINGDLTIKNLTFKYPNTDNFVLKNINLEIKQGKTVAILGKTGSGKTTLANLILRIYSVENNKIFIDGIDINNFSLENLRENIGYVPQDNFLFSSKINSNIKFFKDIFSELEVENATKNVSVFESIQGFPNKFETILGERGVTLSGGQKQRVSMARAIIKTPKILVLDDSLSAVDTKTEREIISNLKKILIGKTGLIISHRISTIQHADEIIVLENGEIIERGNHNELMIEKKYYYDLYISQQAEVPK